YEQTDWAESADGRTGSIECSLRILEGLHERWTRALESMTAEDWKRTAHHPEHGTVALWIFLKTYAAHGANHVKQITDLRAAKGW
ncbi:MAG TPA: DinB family protein, partial [candidate division Zixibacteria bacterium]|nr:DinB family protein [candidate division Zixibacteria bacterium]